MRAEVRVSVAILIAVLMLAVARAGFAAADSPGAQAFLDGYRAYQAATPGAAIEKFKLAASGDPALADYALYYQGLAERDAGSRDSAVATLSRILTDYPQSVLGDPAALTIAQCEFQLGRYRDAQTEAARLAAAEPGADLEQKARMVEASASLAMGDAQGAYAQAQAVRERFPLGSSDGDARAMAYSILASNAGIADTSSLEYHLHEAELLIREGQPGLALTQAEAGLALEPEPAIRAELLWIEARALRVSPEREMAALNESLPVAPDGPPAAAATSRIGHLYWRLDDTQSARAWFRRLLAAHPHDRLAPQTMIDIGRTFEDDDNLSAARDEYLALIARYPASDAAADARFRAPFILYETGNFSGAASGFAAMELRAGSAQDRDMASYWRARSLERAGDSSTGREILERLALSTASNYYPALAEMRLGSAGASLAAASAPDLSAAEIPAAAGSADFHLRRVAALRSLGLTELEPPELRVLLAESRGNQGLRDFVLAEMQRAGAWFDAIEAAIRMAADGGLSSVIAERIRYPRAYWSMVEAECGGNALDPYLVLALMRQESLFNPEARSGSDARGLMQLLPSTAVRVAPAGGVDPDAIDLFDPAQNVRLGTAYLKSLLAMFGGNPFKAVAAYNGGEHAVAKWDTEFPGDDDQWVENIGFRETRDYVKKVIGGLREYRMLYGRASAGRTSAGSPQS